MTLKKLYKKAAKTLEFQRLLTFSCQTRDYTIKRPRMQAGTAVYLHTEIFFILSRENGSLTPQKQKNSCKRCKRLIFLSNF